MNKIYYVIIVLLLIAALAMMAKLRQDYTQLLSTTLYKKKDPKEYMALLESKKAKILIPRKQRLFMKLNLYQICSDVEGVKSLFKQIDDLRLTPNEKLNYLATKIYYAILEGHVKQAARLLDQIKLLAPVSNDPNAMNILHEADVSYRLNIQHDLELKEVLLKDIEEAKTDNEKMLANIRLAKLLYLNNFSENDVNEYLIKAKSFAVTESESQLIDLVLQDHEQLRNA